MNATPDMSNPNEPLIYPITLDRDAIATFLPHRGEMLFIHNVVVFSHNRYSGQACWSSDSAAMKGHFPGFPVVPGVFLVEAVAQVAGAGMFAGDPVARAQREGRIGVLASIRKCYFKNAVLADQLVQINVNCRQIGENVAQVTADIQLGKSEAATVEILVVNTSRQMLPA